MKTEVLIFYDQECPFCQWYSQKLVDFNFLKKSGRLSYQTQSDNYANQFDLNRAKNQLACYIPTQGKTKYGMDGLLFIIGQRLPLLEKVCRFYPIYYFLLALYALISYNRKVIFPGKTNRINCACDPDKSWFWRVVFVVTLSGITGLLVDQYFNLYLISYLNTVRINDIYLLLSQIVFQSMVFMILRQKDWYNYLGQIVFVSFIGSLSLYLILLILQLFEVYIDTTFLAEAGYGATLLLMFNLHKNRLKAYNWSSWLSVSWIVFRLFIYPVVFNL